MKKYVQIKLSVEIKLRETKNRVIVHDSIRMQIKMIEGVKAHHIIHECFCSEV